MLDAATQTFKTYWYNHYPYSEQIASIRMTKLDDHGNAQNKAIAISPDHFRYIAKNANPILNSAKEMGKSLVKTYNDLYGDELDGSLRQTIEEKITIDSFVVKDKRVNLVVTASTWRFVYKSEHNKPAIMTELDVEYHINLYSDDAKTSYQRSGYKSCGK